MKFESLKVSPKRLAPMFLLVSCGLGLCAPAHAITATKEYVDRKDATNAAAIAELASNVYTRAETDARIIALAPAPGNYETVSNRAMSALQAHQSLAPSTNHTDEAIGEVTNRFNEIAGRKAEKVKLASVAYVNGGSLMSMERGDFLGSEMWEVDNGFGWRLTVFRDDNGSWGGFASRTNDSYRTILYEESHTDPYDDFGTLFSGEVTFTNEYAESVKFEYDFCDVVYARDIPADIATKAEVQAVSNQIPPIVNSVNTMWATMYGENVWLAVTNYMRQIQGTVPSLRLWEVRDSSTNLVYSSQEEIEHVVTQRVHTVETNLNAKMTRKAWGSYQSSGEDNPSSNDVTVVNSQKVMLTGGGTWYKAIETSGACVWVLKSQGVTTFGGDTNGFFRIADLEGNAPLEIVKTADQEVDAVASDTDFDASNNFTVTYNASGSNHPLVSCALDLNDDFDEENGNGEINSLGITVTWAKNGDNLWVATIHQDTRAARLFVHAKMTVQGVNLIRNTAPATFDGGIYINNVRYRLVPYSSGGKTYLTLEAW